MSLENVGMRGSTRGSEFEKLRARTIHAWREYTSIDNKRDDGRESRMGLSPAGDRGAAAILMAAGAGTNYECLGLRSRRTVARMRRFADAAGMRGIGHGCQHDRNKVSREREEQNQRGSQTAHAFVKFASRADRLIEE